MKTSARRSNQPQRFGADPWLAPYREALARRRERIDAMERRLTGGCGSLADFASGHEYYGLHRTAEGWVLREWAPNAVAIQLVGDDTAWRLDPAYAFRYLPGSGDWELRLPAAALTHGANFHLRVAWPGGEGVRLPAYARYVTQDPETKLFSARVWAPAEPYRWRHESPPCPAAQLIYESHVGMAQEEPRIGTFDEYRERLLPYLARSGYNTVQLMAVMSHPYYGSFGYHVANFFSIAGRFGTPEQFKALVDEAHGLGLRVIIDLVHSHAVKNEVEGLARQDGTRTAYFHAGARGEHPGWDSLLFDYGKPEVLHFLLSNCRFWLDEYHLDGFRFDGVTSMLYTHHGLNRVFGSYEDYFREVDEEAVTYLGLANRVIHQVRPDAVTVAEDVSGMPGLAAPVAEGGLGFDYRLAMGVTDWWFKLFDRPDEEWGMRELYHELGNRREDEKSISYVECHDQAIVGGQSAMFRLAGEAMYTAMGVQSQNLRIDRAMALHKLTRAVTAATAGHGYLNFMGNEFGHPEWVDFPRAGNGWSYHYARRQWSLARNPELRYRFLLAFDRALLALLNRTPEFYRVRPQLLRCDELGKVLIFERADWIFLVNFHAVASHPDYGFEVPAGRYRLELDSDAPEFGGFGRVAPGQEFHPELTRNGLLLRCYLPNRTLLVLHRLPTGS